MIELPKCRVCDARAVTRLPVVGSDWACVLHAEEYWGTVVRLGAGLARIDRERDAEKARAKVPAITQ